MDSFGDNLKECRKAKNLTLEELAYKYNKRYDGGMSKGTLSKYENNKQEPLISVVSNLAEILDVSADYLLGRTDIPELADYILSEHESDDGVYPVPLFNSVSAGLGRMAESDVVEYVPTQLPYGAGPDDYIRINVSGDSMSPLIDDGSQILVRLQPTVENGTIAVVLLDGTEGFVKRINYGRNWIELESINPYYPAKRFENSDAERITVVGIVKQIIKYL